MLDNKGIDPDFSGAYKIDLEQLLASLGAPAAETSPRKGKPSDETKDANEKLQLVTKQKIQLEEEFSKQLGWKTWCSHFNRSHAVL